MADRGEGTEEDPVNLGSAEKVQVEGVSLEGQRENVRGILAGVLVAILGTTILGSLALLANDRITSQEIKQVAQLFVTPLIAIVGSVVGFYFGGQVAGANQGQGGGKKAPK